MIKVLLTTGHCNPPLTRVIRCAKIRYYKTLGKIKLFNERGNVIAWGFIDEWLAIKYIDEDGQEHIIKGN